MLHRTTALAIGVLATIAAGCNGMDDVGDAPAALPCTDDLGCPTGSRCVDRSYCETIQGAGSPGAAGAQASPAAGAADVPGGGQPTPVPPPGGGDGGVPGDRCVPTQRLCGDVCVDPLSDPRNCGGCGIACLGASVCDRGTCCGPPRAVCGTECVDLERDPRNCGLCGLACPGGFDCVLGVCEEPLPGTPGSGDGSFPF